MMKCLSKSLSETERFAQEVAAQIKPGAVLALVGELGSGKTTFLQYFLPLLGVSRDEVLSPTFVLEHVYQGNYFPVHHYDFYRLKNIQELYELGIDADLPPLSGIAVIEWANLFPQVLPPEYFLLECRLIDENTREYCFTRVGKPA